MFILWQDVQNAFPDVDYVDDIRWGKDEPIRAHFLVGPDGEVYVNRTLFTLFSWMLPKTDHISVFLSIESILCVSLVPSALTE